MRQSIKFCLKHDHSSYRLPMWGSGHFSSHSIPYILIDDTDLVKLLAMNSIHISTGTEIGFGVKTAQCRSTPRVRVARHESYI
ncbi:hypothetical protein TNCT_373811 [Trichonephila clavata]|uniref:Uncharacterized protein n=1 Tax=Trichonephila clavata TaxID=2740835 RepID=A0A8X6K6D9_TRICU|nr:hypothetical protein TNCT_373811 [Trichonephila clavata]